MSTIQEYDFVEFAKDYIEKRMMVYPIVDSQEIVIAYKRYETARVCDKYDHWLDDTRLALMIDRIVINI